MCSARSASNELRDACRRRRIQPFAGDDRLHEGFARGANEQGKVEALKFFEAGENLVVLPARFAEAQAGIEDDLRPRSTPAASARRTDVSKPFVSERQMSRAKG